MMYAVKVRFRVVFEREVILPPFTSKASKTMVIRALESSRFKAALPDRGSRKPYMVTPLFRGGEPLIKLDEPSGVFTARPGEDYWFELRLVGDVLPLITSIASASSYVDVFNSKAHLQVDHVVFKSFEQMGVDGDAKLVRVDALTPVLLRVPTPRGVEPKHSLFPIPSLMMYSLAIHWNKYAPGDLKIPDVQALASYADQAMVEVDYKLRPCTAIYDERRRPRGFIGWTLFKLRNLDDSLHRQLLKLLDYADYVGIGRSKSIGFGMVKVKWEKGG